MPSNRSAVAGFIVLSLTLISPAETSVTPPVAKRVEHREVRHGGYFYYSRTEEGKQYPVQCRRKGNKEAPEEILLDANELAKGHTYLGLGALQVSDDSNLLAYSSDVTGFRQYSLHVKDLRTGETLADTADRVTSLQWAAD